MTAAKVLLLPNGQVQYEPDTAQVAVFSDEMVEALQPAQPAPEQEGGE